MFITPHMKYKTPDIDKHIPKIQPKPRIECKYCHDPFKMFGNGDAGFQINKHDQTISYYDYPAYCSINEDEQFNYCPNCGRKLGSSNE